MRIKQVLAFLGAAALSVSAVAEPSVPASINAANGAAVYRLTPVQVEEIGGIFKLDDGRNMKLTNTNSRVYMELDGKREELIPVSENRFVAKKSGAQVTLDQLPFAEKVELSTARR
jgi:hypothetical protein